jgi:hypothetical protein
MMKLVTFDDYRIGVLRGDNVHEVSEVVPGWTPGDVWGMNRLIAGWDTLRARVEQAANAATPKPLASVKLQAPNPAPTHLFAAPANYRAHVAEMRRQHGRDAGLLHQGHRLHLGAAGPDRAAPERLPHAPLRPRGRDRLRHRQAGAGRVAGGGAELHLRLHDRH